MKAVWKPSVSATAVAVAAARDHVVGAALATAASIARPSAPPTCWEVLISPDARPASCGSTPATAAIVIGTNAKPSPNADEQRREQDVAHVGRRRRETWANQTSPPAISSSPATSTGLKPKRVTSWEATPAETMIASASGR